MPHLSPMNWMLMSLIFWMALLVLIPTIWWHQTPKLPKLSKLPSTPHHLWLWS